MFIGVGVGLRKCWGGTTEVLYMCWGGTTEALYKC